MIREKLMFFIRGAFPLIHIRTNEYDRAEVVVASVHKELKETVFSDTVFRLFRYDAYNGLVDLENQHDKAMITAPDRAIIQLLDSKTPSITIFHNLERICEEHDRFSLLDLLYSAYEIGKENNIYIVNIGLSDPPIELRPFFAVLDFPLPSEEELIKELESFVEEYFEAKPNKTVIREAARLCKGMTVVEAINSIAFSLISTDNIDLNILRKEKAQIVKKSGLLEWIEDIPSLDDVGGFKLFKEWVKRIKAVYLKYDAALKLGIKPPKGILISGIPGTGKSLTAKALAHYLNVPLFRLDVGRMYNSLLGETERRMRETMRLIDAMSPCVVLVDEVEKALSGYRSSGLTDGGTTSRIFGELLYFLQEKKSLSFFVCTANDVQSLPPEFTRKGRFDELWFVDLPNLEERKEIFKIHLSKSKIKKKVELDVLAKETEGFTGSEIEGVVQESLVECLYSQSVLTTEMVLEFVKATRPLSQRMRNEIQAIRKWAEVSGVRRVS